MARKRPPASRTPAWAPPQGHGANLVGARGNDARPKRFAEEAEDVAEGEGPNCMRVIS
jgi:hypothetical protein